MTVLGDDEGGGASDGHGDDGTLGIHGSVNVHKTGDSNNGGRWDNIFTVLVREPTDWGRCLLTKKNRA